MNHCAARLTLLSFFASVSLACGADPNAGKPSAVVISEVMYHPVDEDAAEDNHEFIEISKLRNSDGETEEMTAKE